MDYDSASSCEDRLLDLEGSKRIYKTSPSHSKEPPPRRRSCTSEIYTICKETPSTSLESPVLSTSEKHSRASVKIIKRSLSSQVMEYYHRYSQNANLDRYFCLPDSKFSNSRVYKDYLTSQNVENPWENVRKSMIDSGKSSIRELPRERRRWVRPPLIGQPSGTSSEILSSNYQHHVSDSTEVTSEPDDKINTTGDPDITSEKQPENRKESLIEPIDRENKTTSPTSSVTSHKPLEWDSGADVGYHNLPRNKGKDRNMLCTIERMALARGLCSAALRLDPEGTTGSNVDPSTQNNSPSRSSRRISKPDAHSTRIHDDVSCSDGEIEITPIVKSNVSGIIAGKVVGIQEITLMSNVSRKCDEKKSTDNYETPKTSNPGKSKYATERFLKSRGFKDLQGCLMKKSASMNVLALPITTVELKRSQSELNISGKEEKKKNSQFPLNFASSSSIATIVNKPMTCDKDIQANLSSETGRRESIGIQVSAILEEEKEEESKETENVKALNLNKSDSQKNEDEEKPPLPKRVSSLAHNPLQSILKNSDNSSVRSKRSSGRSENRSSSGTEDETEAGRASNSFEYFPGHVYQNVPEPRESVSHVSSVDTGRSHSTMPNTSSSLDEKLWGDSDNLLRDLERSLSILKSLVDANKCDKHVKKRLIHHVIKRLVNAKYADDKIEHQLEENVPWNPDNARNKVYRNEIIQALAEKQKQPNSTESSEDWKPRKRSSSCGKSKQIDARSLKEMIQLVISSENSDLFEERNTDRTDGMQDGRKARMGLRCEDRHCHKLQRDSINLDTEKSESSECFLPQQMNYKKIDNKLTKNVSTVKTSSSSTNTTEDRTRAGGNDEINWRIPATLSERRFELERCNYRAGANTRLIDYVEMEKKNQLVWINNEINHLSNLKKLLEKPKRYDKRDRRNSPRCSPRKIKTDQHDISNFSTRSLNDQWSSHGNLAERKEKTTRKRNSCTQTGTLNGTNGFSKSDRVEIIAAMESLIRDSGKEVSDACAQTVTPRSSRVPSPSWSPRRNCLIHGNKKGVCQCQRPGSSSPEVTSNTKIQSIDEEGPGVSQPVMSTKKETKNRMNDKCKSKFSASDNKFMVVKMKQHCRGCRCSSAEENSTISDRSKEKFPNNNGIRIFGSETTRRREMENVDECTCDEIQRLEEEKERREVKSCRTCGITYTTVNKKCQCTLAYIKPIAYELNFEDKKIRKSPIGKKTSSRELTPSSDVQSYKTSDSGIAPPPLKDYLTKNRPDFVDNVETRKRYMLEISQLRQLKKEKRMQFLAITSPSHLISSPQNFKPTAKSQRKVSDEEMKMRLRLKYLRLNEVRNKRKQKEKEEQAKRNHLMAKIFCKKLQQKVLNGQVDLSQSVSVISNL